MKTGWYKNSYRRNLVDMHIEDWNDEFLSKLSADEYLANLKRGRIQSAMIYLQNHNGHCYFPTSVGHTHAKFTGEHNEIKRLIELCHENGIDVVGYYSLIYNTYEEDKHKDWKLVGADGMSSRERNTAKNDLGSARRKGLICPNNPEYREFLKIQLKEMLEYFPPLEGMFYDMLFWPEICYCEHCKRRAKDELGLEAIPKCDWRDESFKHFMRRRHEWMGEFAGFVTKFTKELCPGITVEHNFAQAVAGNEINGSTEEVNDWCDYAGGDLYGTLYNHSFAAKYYRGVTKNHPIEYMTCRCDNNLYQHTVTKTERHLECEVMLNVANHAATFIIDAIDPKGTMDKRVYERIGNIFEREMKYEPYMNGDAVTDLAIMYFTGGRYNFTGSSVNNKTASVAASQTLTEKNILFDVVSGRRADISKYKCVIAPHIADCDGEVIAKIIEYVKNGGNFYFSGAEEPELLRALLGAEYEKMGEYHMTYIAPKRAAKRIFGEFNADYPLAAQSRLPEVKFTESENILAYITTPYTRCDEDKFASIHSNPPGIATRIPAVIKKKVGKGTVVWSAFELEYESRYAYREIFSNIIAELLPMGERSVISAAPAQVELLVYKREGSIQVNAINILAGNEWLTLPSFRVSLKSENAPKEIVSITSGKKISHTYKDGYVSFTVKGLKLFEMFEIIF